MLCVLLGCLVFASACGGANTPTGTDAEPVSSDTAPRTTVQMAGETTGAGEAVAGTGGDDVVRAGSGDDAVRGMGGNDEIYGGEGKDRLFGGPGDDVVDAQDPASEGGAGRDEIFCGPGRDEVLMDANDHEKPRGCEMAGVGSS